MATEQASTRPAVRSMDLATKVAKPAAEVIAVAAPDAFLRRREKP
jgi:hypothetical protein